MKEMQWLEKVLVNTISVYYFLMKRFLSGSIFHFHSIECFLQSYESTITINLMELNVIN